MVRGKRRTRNWRKGWPPERHKPKLVNTTDKYLFCSWLYPHHLVSSRSINCRTDDQNSGFGKDSACLVQYLICCVNTLKNIKLYPRMIEGRWYSSFSKVAQLITIFLETNFLYWAVCFELLYSGAIYTKKKKSHSSSILPLQNLVIPIQFLWPILSISYHLWWVYHILSIGFIDYAKSFNCVDHN